MLLLWSRHLQLQNSDIPKVSILLTDKNLSSCEVSAAVCRRDVNVVRAVTPQNSKRGTQKHGGKSELDLALEGSAIFICAIFGTHVKPYFQNASF